LSCLALPSTTFILIVKHFKAFCLSHTLKKPFFSLLVCMSKFSRNCWYLSVNLLPSTTLHSSWNKHFQGLSLSFSLSSNSHKCDIWLEFWTLNILVYTQQHTQIDE
jgi:hypothetical protein